MTDKKEWNTIVQKKPKINKSVTTNGENIQLQNKYVLWCHDINSKDWSLQGYSKLCTVSNVSEFWKLFNNLDKIGYKVNNLFFMKEDIDPTWEHEKNRYGGTCSLKTEINDSLNIYEELCSYMVCNILSKQNDITGISFSPKNNWAIIKVWNSDKIHDLSITMNEAILEKYKDHSIKYKENQPEF